MKISRKLSWVLSFLFVLTCNYSFSQQLNWALSIGGVGEDVSNAVYTDAQGNVYKGGRFGGVNVDFDPGPGSFLMSSSGAFDAYIAKYTASGQFLWAIHFGGNDRDNVNALTVDKWGNVIVTGYFRGANVDFDPGPGTFLLTSNGQSGGDPGYGGDSFLAKYDPDGNFLWAFGTGGGLLDNGLSVTTDIDGDIYVGGHFLENVDFDPGPGNAMLDAARGSIFLSKYSASGNYLWAFNFGLGNADGGIFGLTTDASKNVAITGFFQGVNQDFDPSPGTALLSSNGAYECFIGKYNTNGQYISAFSIGGSSSDVGRSLIFDAVGNLYVIGDFGGSVDLDPGVGVHTINSNGPADVFVAKYTPSNVLAWGFNFGGSGGEFGWSITSDGSHLFLTGGFTGSSDMDPSSNIDNLVSAGGYDIFLAKYSLDGQYSCSFKIGGAGDDFGQGTYSPATNLFYITGSFKGANIDFDPTSGTTAFSSAGAEDTFLTQYYWADPALPTGTLTGSSICPGDAATLTFTAATGSSPFTIVYSDGTNNYTATSVQSGVPFNVQVPPTVTTHYTLVSVTDGIRCSPVNNAPNSGADVAVSTSCQIDCTDWLKTDATGAKLTAGDIDVGGDQLTVEALFNRTQPLNSGLYFGSLVSKHSTQADVNYSLLPNGCEITTTSGYKSIFAPCQPALNKVYHVAMVYDGTSLKFYSDGFLMAQTPCTGTLVNNDLLTTIGQLASGTNLPDNQFGGYVNEVRIWNRALSQDEVRQTMGGPLANPTTQPGLLAYYTFNSLVNRQGNSAYNGTLVSPATINANNPNCNFSIDSCGILPEIIVNDYTPVLNYEGCNNTLVVEDASAFHVGDTILLAQMKGVIIDSNNTVAYGSIRQFNNAGNFEYNRIKALNGNRIDLEYELLRTYDMQSGFVQLVRVPYFDHYAVTGKLTCLPWDGRKGGILAFNVENDLKLNADIDVAGRGFLGGSMQVTTTHYCDIDSFYVNDNDGSKAARKGEGAYYTPAKLSGRGRSANGGGGGNSVNSGGAGGGNGGVGGDGGKEYRGAACNTNFTNGGVGGVALPYSNTDTRIFLGGGGGAGHADDAQLGSGGNGGGIVLISAGTITPFSHKISADGVQPIHLTGANDDGRSGGGAGGTVLLNYSSATSTLKVSAKGGRGDDCIASPAQNLYGPGGGGGGGVVWTSKPSADGIITPIVAGGNNGVNINQGSNPWGASSGANGVSLYGLTIPVASQPFINAIDSVFIKDIQQSCLSFAFSGVAHSRFSSIADWFWDFGDGSTAATQNAAHSFSAIGIYQVKLVVTDANGCKDSATVSVDATQLTIDFSFSVSACSPLDVEFYPSGATGTTSFWDFGDLSASNANGTVNHSYSNNGNFLVTYAVTDPVCSDTVRKTISLQPNWSNLILTNDTTICVGDSKLLRSTVSENFCWSPATDLDDPLLPQPTTSTAAPITYYLHTDAVGVNLLSNGDFEQGSTGFSSDYISTPANGGEGEITVGSSPSAWNSSFASCNAHGGSGKMLIVNGGPEAKRVVWQQTVAVTPNTSYQFSTWIQSLETTNPANLRFAINGITVEAPLTGNVTTCSWIKYAIQWNSGGGTSATLAIENWNATPGGNDFALDDLSFSTYAMQWDSVKIDVDHPVVQTIGDTSICKGSSVTLTTNGAQSYSWTPTTYLSDPDVASPVATPVAPTQFIVAGESAFGCIAKDTVNVAFYPDAAVSVSDNVEICLNASTQLEASGGVGYLWSPASSLDDPTIANPVANPTDFTRYYVDITDVNSCHYLDSVDVSVRPPVVFTISGPDRLCAGDTIQLTASGGDTYQWQPAVEISDPTIPNPRVFPTSTTTFEVTVTDETCNFSQTLSKTVDVLSKPSIVATRSVDLDCANDHSQLMATGGIKYQWTPTETLVGANFANPVARPKVTTDYIVKGTDRNGCFSYDTVTVKVGTGSDGMYLMPSGFTPDKDGKNDCYGIQYWGSIDALDFSIYNRWGQLMFHSTQVGACWDGTFKGIQQPADVYVYMIRASTNCDKNVFRKGTFVLIR